MYQYTLHPVQNFPAMWPEIRDFLKTEEAAHNLLLGLFGYFSTQPEWQPEMAFAAVLRDANHDIVMTALRTTGHNLILSQSAHPDSVDPLAEHLDLLKAEVPGVLGPKELSLRFAAIWQRRTGRRFVLEVAERIHELTEVIIAPSPLGTFRRLQSFDRDWLIEWLQQFVFEAMPHQSPEAFERAQQSARKIDHAASDAGFFVLEVDGVPRCVVGYGNPTLKGIRIGPVYTPMSSRGHGYATELVRAVSQNLLDWGYQRVYLFTDVANPTSNRIYRRIGYRPVADVDSYAFVEDPATIS